MKELLIMSSTLSSCMNFYITQLHVYYFITLEVGIAKRYISNDLAELNQLQSDVEAITAHEGGDCPELGMEGILRALRLAYDHSQVIVMTDAGCKDYDKKEEVVELARNKQTKIHFFFSGPGCRTDFEHYKYVQHRTGGVSVDTIESFQSLALFIAELNPEETSKRSIHSKDSSLSSFHKCQTFNISMFTTKFELVVNQTSTSVTIYDPLGYSVKNQHISDDLSGYVSKGQPRNGSWRICTVDETPEFTISKNDILDFTVDYNQDGHYSTTIPTAGTCIHTLHKWLLYTYPCRYAYIHTYLHTVAVYSVIRN